jgi:hypothetical protein
MPKSLEGLDILSAELLVRQQIQRFRMGRLT